MLANWLIEPRNPLTARVIVNRLWQFHFGAGIVATPSDFGVNGVRPTHPELLDWLAAELISHRWSLKHIQRLILNSHTFQQSSHPRAEPARTDAGCRLLWRFPPRRVAAEVLRDSILAATGVLDRRMGGPGFSAFRVERENVRHYFPKDRYDAGDWRRMIYMTKVRQEQDSVFGIFDCPDASQVVAQRNRSTTPLQALNLLNSSFVLQQTDLFATRLVGEFGGDVDRQIVGAFQICFGRAPGSEQRSDAARLVAEYGLAVFCRAMLNANEFLFIP